MAYDRYPRGTQPGDYYNRNDEDYGRDYGSGRDYGYSSARDYEAAGEFGGNRDRDRYGARDGGRDQRWGQQDYGNAGYAQSFRGRGGYGTDRQYGQQSGRYGNEDRGYGQSSYGQSYGSQGRSFGGDRDRSWDRSGWERDRSMQSSGNRGDYGRPQGYDPEDRGFFQRAGDEVRSWFGDDEAERRRDMDARYDEQRYANDRDSDYHSWRHGQISALDRDYDEYRRENRTKFENEFTSWRTNRQGQRDLLTKVTEHMEVLGSDGTHVGTVDKVRGDRILLTKNDQDAGGHHHSIPSSWLKTVDTQVTLSKTADEAKKHWRDEEDNQAMLSGDRDRDQSGQTAGRDAQGRMLNRSFSGTY